ncbi:ABC transporter permease [Acidicapsa ligni]|uniref:ABC transporter permease n=1 Tax=Acidicapsa ligni TaxID=542300 RepID=UPI0021E06245|nr:ABC transporter permease [Acidicapsa ligni]
MRTKDASNAALSEELQFHLERQVEENIANGMFPEEARAAARAEFGSVIVAAEKSYEARGVRWLDDLWQDLRYGVRTLLKQRSFTVVTVLTLALGIGACTAIFSVVNAVMLRSLPYGDPEGLVYLYTPYPQMSLPAGILGSGNSGLLPAEVFGPSYGDFLDFKKLNHSYSAMTLFDQDTFTLAGDGRADRVNAAKVDEGFFGTLQSMPEMGRVFSASDEQPGNDHVVVLSYALWQQLFGGRADVLGRTLRLDGRSYQVIGVMPREFGYPHKSEVAYGNGHIQVTQLWVPLGLTSKEWADRELSSGNVLARLKPGVTVAAAQSEISALSMQLGKLHSAGMQDMTGLVRPFREISLGSVKPLMGLLLGAVGFVLLIACGNAANLLLARAANRTQELGMRAALGARRGRIVRQMLTESLLLGSAAGALGVVLAYLFQRVLLRLDPSDIPRMQDASLDLRVMGFLVVVTMLTSVLFGLLPALSASRVNLVEFLKSGASRGIAGGRSRVRSGLVIAQVALVVILLTGAGLFLRSYAKILSVQTGFSASTVVANVGLTPNYDTSPKRLAFFNQVIDRLKALLGTEAVGAVDYLPLTNSESLTFVQVEGDAEKRQKMVESRAITADYLSAMQTRLIQGRGFTSAEEAGLRTPAVSSTAVGGAVIVNEAFAKEYFSGASAIGHRLRYSKSEPWVTIVGEVADVRNESLEMSAASQIYTPFAPVNGDNAYITVRSLQPKEVVVAEIRGVVRSLDASLAVADVHGMNDLVSQAVARRRFQTTLLTVFSGIAMLLAIVGVYGLLAYSVRQRTGEIGIRMALGSSRAGVVRLILREGLGLLAIGLVLGLAGAFASTRLLGSFLYGVPALDPITFVVVPAVLFLATLGACLIPGLRAAAVSPVQALRHE